MAPKKRAKGSNSVTRFDCSKFISAKAVVRHAKSLMQKVPIPEHNIDLHPILYGSVHRVLFVDVRYTLIVSPLSNSITYLTLRMMIMDNLWLAILIRMEFLECFVMNNVNQCGSNDSIVQAARLPHDGLWFPSLITTLCQKVGEVLPQLHAIHHHTGNLKTFQCIKDGTI
ncbi:Uncharacterized protein TCM_017776 [Theobroma cacao]|uniref:Uncharacterized protein n=1 Tax=Theobroma cacao TaxID=3641 RepID=A0A061EFQ2_THECC|nr:Uncharacterized protein TCM_017776 [Theobroma cacao]